MAIFQAFNAAEVGFNMSSTSSSGWAFMAADPHVTMDLTYDDGSLATFDVLGSDLIDYFSATYWSDGYQIIVEDLYYEWNGFAVLSIKDLNLHTTVDELEGNAWYVALNRGSDTFYGNDYADLIRAGRGNDTVYSYGGDDIVFGELGNDRLYGLDGEDDLYGGSGRDVLNGGFDSDYLSGGTGRDKLTGGEGEDYFVFDTRPSASSLDRITDFTPGDDTIMLDNRAFKRVGPDGWLSTSAFKTGAKAGDTSDRVIYNPKTGAVLYDPDGTGKAAAIKFAQMKSGLFITADDFFVL